MLTLKKNCYILLSLQIVKSGEFYHYNKLLYQIIKCLNQIINENKLYNLRHCTFIFHKFQEKNLNLNRDSNSDLLISRAPDLEIWRSDFEFRFRFKFFS